MRMLASFIGKNRDFRNWLAAREGKRPDYGNVIYLHRCELCGRMARGSICRRCEPLFQKWTKKIAFEMKAAEKKHPDPSIA